MDFIIKQAVTNDCSSIYSLMKEAAASAGKTGWFASDDLNFIKSHVSDRGLILKACPCSTMPEEIAAFLIIRFPESDPDNLGTYFNLNSTALNHVAHMETVAVGQNYRGNSLQHLLLAAGEREAASRGFSYLMATVHPENIYSLKNFQRLGYKKLGEALKYGGLRRWILGKKI